MNFEQLEGKWKQYKGQVRENWGHLTDDDLQVIGGKRDKLIGRIQERYGLARERASEEVDAFMRTLHDHPRKIFVTRMKPTAKNAANARKAIQQVEIRTYGCTSVHTNAA
jgi:uncharacterized protein YjbJ (UPF0337 family)